MLFRAYASLIPAYGYELCLNGPMAYGKVLLYFLTYTTWPLFSLKRFAKEKKTHFFATSAVCKTYVFFHSQY